MLAIRKPQIIHFEILQIFNSECPLVFVNIDQGIYYKKSPYSPGSIMDESLSDSITHPLIYNKVFIIFFAKFCAKYGNASFRINPLRKTGEFGLCL